MSQLPRLHAEQDQSPWLDKLARKDLKDAYQGVLEVLRAKRHQLGRV